MDAEEIRRLEQDVQRILQWPRETWSEEEITRLHERRALLHQEMFALNDGAERHGRNLTPEEREAFDRMQGEYDRLGVAVPSPR
jgi:hypothetical protein